MNSKMVARRARIKAEKKAAKEAKKNKNPEFKVPAAIASSSSKVNKVPGDFFDEPAAKKIKIVEKSFGDQECKKTSDKSKVKSSKLGSSQSTPLLTFDSTPSSTFNKFAEQARVEKEAAARPVKDKANVEKEAAAR